MVDLEKAEWMHLVMKVHTLFQRNYWTSAIIYWRSYWYWTFLSLSVWCLILYSLICQWTYLIFSCIVRLKVSVMLTLSASAAENIGGVIAAIADLLRIAVPPLYEITRSPSPPAYSTNSSSDVYRFGFIPGIKRMLKIWFLKFTGFLEFHNRIYWVVLW